MRQSFQQTPDLTPYDAVEPKQSIYERNPQLDALTGQKKLDAIASSQMNWQEPDDVPTAQLNAILWRDSNETPYPIWKKHLAALRYGGMQ
jgi:hypothetical protein